MEPVNRDPRVDPEVLRKTRGLLRSKVANIDNVELTRRFAEDRGIKFDEAKWQDVVPQMEQWAQDTSVNTSRYRQYRTLLGDQSAFYTDAEIAHSVARKKGLRVGDDIATNSALTVAVEGHASNTMRRNERDGYTRLEKAGALWRRDMAPGSYRNILQRTARNLNESNVDRLSELMGASRGSGSGFTDFLGYIDQGARAVTERLGVTPDNMGRFNEVMNKFANPDNVRKFADLYERARANPRQFSAADRQAISEGVRIMGGIRAFDRLQSQGNYAQRTLNHAANTTVGSFQDVERNVRETANSLGWKNNYQSVRAAAERTSQFHQAVARGNNDSAQMVGGFVGEGLFQIVGMATGGPIAGGLLYGSRGFGGTQNREENTVLDDGLELTEDRKADIRVKALGQATVEGALGAISTGIQAKLGGEVAQNFALRIANSPEARRYLLTKAGLANTLKTFTLGGLVEAAEEGATSLTMDGINRLVNEATDDDEVKFNYEAQNPLDQIWKKAAIDAAGGFVMGSTIGTGMGMAMGMRGANERRAALKEIGLGGDIAVGTVRSNMIRSGSTPQEKPTAIVRNLYENGQEGYSGVVQEIPKEFGDSIDLQGVQAGNEANFATLPQLQRQAQAASALSAVVNGSDLSTEQKSRMLGNIQLLDVNGNNGVEARTLTQNGQWSGTTLFGNATTKSAMDEVFHMTFDGAKADVQQKIVEDYNAAYGTEHKDYKAAREEMASKFAELSDPSGSAVERTIKTGAKLEIPEGGWRTAVVDLTSGKLKKYNDFSHLFVAVDDNNVSKVAGLLIDKGLFVPPTPKANVSDPESQKELGEVGRIRSYFSYRDEQLNKATIEPDASRNGADIKADTFAATFDIDNLDSRWTKDEAGNYSMKLGDVQLDYTTENDTITTTTKEGGTLTNNDAIAYAVQEKYGASRGIKNQLEKGNVGVTYGDHALLSMGEQFYEETETAIDKAMSDIGLTGNVLVLTDVDLTDSNTLYSLGFYGQHDLSRHLDDLSPNTFAAAVYLVDANGDSVPVIIINTLSGIAQLSSDRRMDIIYHELGHIVSDKLLGEASQETKDAIEKEYQAWKKRLTEETNAATDLDAAIEELSDSVRPVTARLVQERPEYFLSMREFMAEQVKKAYIGTLKSENIPFFKKVLDALTQFYQSLTNTKPGSMTVEELITGRVRAVKEGVENGTILELNLNEFNKQSHEQMSEFYKENIDDPAFSKGARESLTNAMERRQLDADISELEDRIALIRANNGLDVETELDAEANRVTPPTKSILYAMKSDPNGKLRTTTPKPFQAGLPELRSELEALVQRRNELRLVVTDDGDTTETKITPERVEGEESVWKPVTEWEVAPEAELVPEATVLAGRAALVSGHRLTYPAASHKFDNAAHTDLKTRYVAMKNTPKREEVELAYQRLRYHLFAHFEDIMSKTGLKITIGEPQYNSMAELLDDVRNGRLTVPVSNISRSHPLAVKAGIFIGETELNYDQIFNVVFNVLGHGSYGFNSTPMGTMGAFMSYAQTLGPEARSALMTEVAYKLTGGKRKAGIMDFSGTPNKKNPPNAVVTRKGDRIPQPAKSFDDLVEMIMNASDNVTRAQANGVAALIKARADQEGITLAAYVEKYISGIVKAGSNLTAAQTAVVQESLQQQSTGKTVTPIVKVAPEVSPVNLSTEANRRLDVYLATYLSQYGVSTIELGNIKTELGLDTAGVADLLQKIIYVNQDRTNTTVPQKAGAMLVLLMSNDPKIKELIATIHKWDGYAKVVADFSAAYNGNEDQIKIEAVGQLLGRAIVVKSEMPTGIFGKAVAIIRELVQVMNKFDLSLRINQIAYDIASDVLNGRDIANNRVPAGRKIVNPDDVLAQNPDAKKLFDVAKQHNGKITGSIALANYGAVYRPEGQQLHDVDFVFNTEEDTQGYINYLVNDRGAALIQHPFRDDKIGITIYRYAVSKEGYTISNIGYKSNNYLETVEFTETATGRKITTQFDTVEYHALGVMVDVFHNPGQTANVDGFSSGRNIFETKLGFSPNGKIGFKRAKDQEDFINFRPTRFENSLDNRYVMVASSGVEPLTPTEAEKVQTLLDQLKTETAQTSDTDTNNLQQKHRGVTKGDVTFDERGKALIQLAETADVTTLVHELAHVFRRNLRGVELKAAEKLLGVKDGKWTTAHEEKFARMFERYIANGRTSNEELEGVFKSMRKWFKSVYGAITDKKLAKLNPKAKAFFESLLDVDTTAELRQLNRDLSEGLMTPEMVETIEANADDALIRDNIALYEDKLPVDIVKAVRVRIAKGEDVDAIAKSYRGQQRRDVEAFAENVQAAIKASKREIGEVPMEVMVSFATSAPTATASAARAKKMYDKTRNRIWNSEYITFVDLARRHEDLPFVSELATNISAGAAFTSKNNDQLSYEESVTQTRTRYLMKLDEQFRKIMGTGLASGVARRAIYGYKTKREAETRLGMLILDWSQASPREQKLKPVVDSIRTTMDEFAQYMIDNGILDSADLVTYNYNGNLHYFPRMYNHDAIMNNKDSFTDLVEKSLLGVYKAKKYLVNTTGKTLFTEEEIRGAVDLARSMPDPSATILAEIKAAAENITERQISNGSPAGNLPPLSHVAPGFISMLPGFTKKRSLWYVPDTELAQQGFTHTNAVGGLHIAIMKGVDAVERQRYFGVNGEAFEVATELIKAKYDKIRKSGISAVEGRKLQNLRDNDLKTLLNIRDTIYDRVDKENSHSKGFFSGVIQLLSTMRSMATLGFAAFSTIGEYGTMPHTVGSINTIKTLMHTFGAISGKVITAPLNKLSLGLIPVYQTRMEKMAMELGLISSPLESAFAASRHSVDIASLYEMDTDKSFMEKMRDSPHTVNRYARLMQERFFRYNMLEAATRLQIIASYKAAEHHVGDIMTKHLKGKKLSGPETRDLEMMGLRGQELDDYATWFKGYLQAKDKIAYMNTTPDMRDNVHMRALRRVAVNMVTQPNELHKPHWANSHNPYKRSFLMLKTFIFGVQSHNIARVKREWKEGGVAGKAGVLFKWAPSMMFSYLMNVWLRYLFLKLIYTGLFGMDEVEAERLTSPARKEPEQLVMEIAISTNIGGPLTSDLYSAYRGFSSDRKGSGIAEFVSPVIGGITGILGATFKTLDQGDPAFIWNEFIRSYVPFGGSGLTRPLKANTKQEIEDSFQFSTPDLYDENGQLLENKDTNELPSSAFGTQY